MTPLFKNFRFALLPFRFLPLFLPFIPFFFLNFAYDPYFLPLPYQDTTFS